MQALSPDVTNSNAYGAIRSFYGSRCAERSGVPLINHINEGLVILERIGADQIAKEAFCIHPLVQADADLNANWIEACAAAEPCVIMLAMEYRWVANGFLSDKVHKGPPMIDGDPYECYAHQPITLSPLKYVNDMLIADKVQNRKDFELYHKGTHARSDELDYYFRLWLRKLGITEERYNELIEGL